MKTNILIHYSLELATPFHFGTGLSSGTIDRLARRDAEGYLMIPATTIKGVLREEVENLIVLCEKFGFLKEPFVKVLNTDEHLNYFRWTSVVDRIFGSPQYEGTLYFDDLKMNELSRELVSVGNRVNFAPANYLQTQQRTQTRIMRKTRTVARGALFKSEYGNPDLKFDGRIYGQLDGIKMQVSDFPKVTYELFFLISALKLINKIGGNKSIGMGSIDVTINEVFLDDEKVALNSILSNEICDIVDAEFYADDKKAYQEEGRQNEN